MSKVIKIFLIILLIAITAFITIFFIRALTDKNFTFSNMFNFSKQSISTNLIIEKEFEETVENISIDAEASKVEIKIASDEKVKVEVYSEIEESDVLLSNNKLTINSKAKKCNFMCFNNIINRIVVYVPSTYDKKITIKNNLGDIEVASFENAEFDIDLDLGDVEINSVKKADIYNKLGDIEVYGHSEELNLKNDCGDIKVDEVDSVTVENKLGDIKIKKVNSYLNLHDNCGDIKLGTINLTKDSKIVNNLGDIKIEDTNEIYINAKTSLGDTKINNNYNKSDITLTITDDLGDIKVQN